MDDALLLAGYRCHYTVSLSIPRQDRKGRCKGVDWHTMHRWFQDDEVALGDWLREPRAEAEGSSATCEITSMFRAMR